jgi:hypothetical protein
MIKLKFLISLLTMSLLVYLSQSLIIKDKFTICPNSVCRIVNDIEIPEQLNICTKDLFFTFNNKSEKGYLTSDGKLIEKSKKVLCENKKRQYSFIFDNKKFSITQFNTSLSIEYSKPNGEVITSISMNIDFNSLFFMIKKNIGVVLVMILLIIVSIFLFYLGNFFLRKKKFLFSRKFLTTKNALCQEPTRVIASLDLEQPLSAVSIYPNLVPSAPSFNGYSSQSLTEELTQPIAAQKVRFFNDQGVHEVATVQTSSLGSGPARSSLNQMTPLSAIQPANVAAIQPATENAPSQMTPLSAIQPATENAPSQMTPLSAIQPANVAAIQPATENARLLDNQPVQSASSKETQSLWQPQWLPNQYAKTMPTQYAYMVALQPNHTLASQPAHSLWNMNMILPSSKTAKPKGRTIETREEGDIICNICGYFFREGNGMSIHRKMTHRIFD